MSGTLSSLKMLNPSFGGTDPIYAILNSNFMQRCGKLKLGYEYLGEHSVKNIAKPVRVYRRQH
jgi:hypothetical protein